MIRALGLLACLTSDPPVLVGFARFPFAKLLAFLIFAATSCLFSDPALAQCAAPADIAGLNWGKAQRFDGLTATRLMQAMLADANQAGRLTDLRIYNVPAVDEIYVLPAGDQVLIIRVKGMMLCADDPVDRTTFDDALRWVLPGAA